jgi:putative salt-induced outer membrane protein YdiY
MRPAIVLAALALALAPATAAAQIVNVQSILSRDAPAGFSGSIDASVDWRTGNTELLVLSAAPVVRFRDGDHLIIAIVRGELGIAAGDRIVAKTFEHLRYRRRFSPWLTAEAFVQHEYDEFRRLELRAVAGAGPKLELWQTPAFELSWGVAYMLEHEVLDDRQPIDAGLAVTRHRASTYLMARGAIADRLDASQTVYAQPRLDRPADTRVLAETLLTVHATVRVAIKISFTLAYDSEPPASIEALDTTLKSSVSVSF